MRARRGGIALPSLAAGVLIALSVPPFGFWPDAFVGAGLLYWRLGGLGLRGRLLAGWLAGVGCFAIGLFWAESFNWYGGVVLAVVEALFFAVAAAFNTPRRGRGLSFVGAFTLLEAARMTWPFGGLPVGGVFLGQAGGPLLGAARLGGPLILTALVWTGGVALGELASAIQRGAHRPVPLAAAVALVLVVAVGAVGAVAPDGGPPTRSIAVAAVQGGGTRGFSAIETGRAGDFAAELDASGGLASAGPRPVLIVWPEDVVALTRPLAGSTQAAVLGPRGRVPRDRARRGDGHRAGGHVPQRDRGLGPDGSRGRRLREGAPGTLRRVRA